MPGTSSANPRWAELAAPQLILQRVSLAGSWLNGGGTGSLQGGPDPRASVDDLTMLFLTGDPGPGTRVGPGGGELGATGHMGRPERDIPTRASPLTYADASADAAAHPALRDGTVQTPNPAVRRL